MKTLRIFTKLRLSSFFIIFIFLSSIYGLVDNTRACIPNYKDENTLFFEIFSGAIEVSGSGYPEDAIAWCNFEEAFDDYPELKTNYGDYKIAILDSGLDEATWDEFDDDYGSYLDIQYVDENGTRSSNPTNGEDLSSINHGTMMTSIIVSCLEREDEDVYGDITMFQTFSTTDTINTTLIKEQLQWIMDWNDDYSDHYKVISMSMGAFGGYINQQLSDLIKEAADDYDIIMIAPSGNFQSSSKQIYEYVEDKTCYPASMPEVVGVGAFYGSAETNGLNISRMSTLNDTTTNSLYIGSCFSHKIQGQTINFVNKTVENTASGYKIEAKCDYYDNGTVINVIASGTSMAVPQVAVAAYLAARKGYYDNSSDFMNPERFFACIYQTSENHADSRNLTTSERVLVNHVGVPTSNYDEYTIFYSYKIGYGALDVQDMMEYVSVLS